MLVTKTTLLRQKQKAMMKTIKILPIYMETTKRNSKQVNYLGRKSYDKNE